MSKKPQHSVRVDLGDRSYDIIIGQNLLSRAADFMTPHLASKKVLIVTDETVGTLYRDKINLNGLDAAWVTVPVGEASKSFAQLQIVLDAMFTHGMERNDTIVALGGGIVGDLTGFAASVFKRGCRFIQIPTTLLAQVDSAVGGKTAINVPQGKNLVGAFYQPTLVLADMDALSTLPLRALKAGYAEILKYGLLGDAAFFAWLKDNGPAVIGGDKDAIAQAVKVSCETKARIVAGDERERGQRALLNLGHTFGHALEAEAGYSGDLLHGEAVSAGMEMAFDFSVALGLCHSRELDALRAHMKKTQLVGIKDVAPLLGKPDALLSHMDQDKKNENGAITLILARRIGEAFVQKNTIRETLSNYLKYLAVEYGGEPQGRISRS
ncbi:3-dehydroquinate synthase [Fretibacter rubidus]|uniref:3-dehydroquinate synthase n=1 Tax=Fretibacter rubidus TaxID=570162 RepID=UPI00352A09A2